MSKRPDLRYERRFWKSGFNAIAGVDEAGVGPMAGPVVAAAVIFAPETFIKGVHDSKQLTPEVREDLFAVIGQRALAIGVGIADHHEIDRLNIYWATMAASRRALEALERTPDHVLADGRKIPGIDHPQTVIVGGDRKSFCIAAASIIAKVTRDRMMIEFHEQYPAYGFASHKGYCTAAHFAALASYGPSPIHRRSFAPVMNAGQRELFAMVEAADDTSSIIEPGDGPESAACSIAPSSRKIDD